MWQINKNLKRKIVTIMIAMLIVPVLLTTSIISKADTIAYGQYVYAGGRIYDIFGLTLALIVSNITFAYDYTTNQFVLQYPYTIITNYVSIPWYSPWTAYFTSTQQSPSTSDLHDFAAWVAKGPFNGYSGYTEIDLATTNTPGQLYFYWVVFVYNTNTQYGGTPVITNIPIEENLIQALSSS